jgi:GT2 family glycosyltransferase
MAAEMSDAELLYIVITDFDGWQQTRTCLERLQESSCTNFRVIVVDHGTSPETAKGLSNFEWAIHVRASSNLWWAGATNLGIREALNREARYIMLLNNDCYVNESTLENLLQHVSAGEARVVAPVQRDAATGKILVVRAGTCFLLGFPTVVTPRMRRLLPGDGALLPTRLIIGGRGVLVRADVFAEVGLFDEQALPHYGADHDFFLRCRRRSVSLFIAKDSSVDIDSTRTTQAKDPGTMNWREFKASLRDTRSHRNIDALTTLFRRYYPVRVFFLLGVLLNLGRYFLSYLLQRASRILRRSD